MEGMEEAKKNLLSSNPSLAWSSGATVKLNANISPTQFSNDLARNLDTRETNSCTKWKAVKSAVAWLKK